MQRLNLQNVFSRPSANSILASSYRGVAVKVHTFCRGSPHRLFALDMFCVLFDFTQASFSRTAALLVWTFTANTENGCGSPPHPLKYLNIFKESSGRLANMCCGRV